MADAAPEDEPPPRPVRWKRYKLPVNRKDNAVRTSAPLPAEPSRHRTSSRTVVWILLLVLGIPVVGCLLFAMMLWLGIR